MSRFTFYGDSKRFNANCTSDLLFDNLDGSDERIFCTESTCVDSQYRGLPISGPCLNSMVPAPSTGETFVWGLEGGSWAPSINYGEIFPASPNEFVANGARFITPQPITFTGCNWSYQPSIGRYEINQNAFSSNWAIQETSYTGYQAMASNSLNRAINIPSGLGSNIYSPAFVNNNIAFGFNGCLVFKTYTEPIESGFFNVGVDPDVPPPHDVTFPNVLITLTPNFIFHQSGAVPDAQYAAEKAFFDNYVLGGDPCNGVTYSSGNHPGPDLASLAVNWTYSAASGGSLHNARSYSPILDRDPPAGYQKGIRTDSMFITGYKMQRFVQRRHTVAFGTGGASIQSALSHTETRIGLLGYRAKWVFKSATPTYVFPSVLTFTGTSVTYSFQAKASIVVTVSYDKLTAYTPKTTDPLTSANHYLIVKERYAGEILPGTFFTHSANPPSSDISNVLSPKNVSKTLYYTYPVPWNTANMQFRYSKYYTPVISPPGTGYISYGGQNFTRLGNVAHPSYPYYLMTLPGTPSNFKIWRRLVEDGSTSSIGGDFSLGFSNRTEWFNGTCPFDLKFDRDLSDNLYLPNLCSSTIVPYLEPTG